MVLRDPGHEKQMLLYIVAFIAILVAGILYAFTAGV